MDTGYFDKIVSDYFGDETPGLSLLIGKDGQILLEKAYGLADLDTGVKIRTDNNFIIASITKQFTCMALMILKERGLLDYDETIEKFFPDFPDYRKYVTLRQMMGHTSGIKEYFEDDGYRENEELLSTADTKTLIQLVKGFGDLGFEPDTQFSYSNSAYVMLGSVIEQISGMTFGAFLKENIFDPADMTRTYAPDYCDNRNSNLVKGYIKKDGGYTERAYDMLAVGYADGNVFSTTGDLFKWNQILNTEKLVKKQTYAEALTSHRLKDGSQTGYGFGLFLGEYKGHKEIWHTGGTMGYVSRYSRYPDDGLTIIMLTNCEGNPKDEMFFRITDEAFRQLLV